MPVTNSGWMLEPPARTTGVTLTSLLMQLRLVNPYAKLSQGFTSLLVGIKLHTSTGKGKKGPWRLQREMILSSMPSLHSPQMKWMKPHAKPSISTLPNCMGQRSLSLSTNTDTMSSWNHTVQRKGKTLLQDSRGLMLVASLHAKMSSPKKSNVPISSQ